ncbi:unnamed protein product [Cylicocyclus nassatus]|uniref:Apple domain-containing protein n=1 Tax=Cylicocyclus nassatus TaxID=53992 RepID=A0AA36MEU8_CYLNA|nr:unnamed protein product [Cylicocyclus nassatus]
MWLAIIFLYFAVWRAEAGRVTVSKTGHIAKLDELCARMHNNTALEGVDPVDMLQANAVECQRSCVDMYPFCTAVVYYYLHDEAQKHNCYLFEHNSLHEKAKLVKQNPEHEDDVVRMLELAPNCHKFDSFPPLEEDELVTSTDKVDRKKRQNANDTVVLGVGDWTDWSSCTKNGFESRSQACEYGRKIQRRGCPARQPLQHFSPVPEPTLTHPQPFSRPDQYRMDSRLQLNEDSRMHAGPEPPQVERHPYSRNESPRAQSQPFSRPGAERNEPNINHLNQSPYDEYARRYLERLAQQRIPQRHAALPFAQPCAQGICPSPESVQPPQPTPPLQLPTPPAQSGLREFIRPQVEVREPPRYRPAPPPPPACHGEGCLPRSSPAQPSGVWYDWSDWSACSCTCGEGMKQRRRECMGNNCQGPDYDTAPCDMGPCETWSEWCEWSTCSGSCGRGERQRTRFCLLGTQRCEGKDFEMETCDAGPCPEWANWEEWGRCSASCGSGVARRQRTCLGGDQQGSCPGPSTEERPCEELPCSTWSPWQDWGSCTVSCGHGIKRRQRVCQYGTDCPGPAEETEPCFSHACATWTQWTDWSDCTSQCGPGQRSRKRSCRSFDGAESKDCPGAPVETTLCEGTTCCRWSDWCAWSSCDRECGIGHTVRTRACVNGDGMIDAACHCEGPDREQKECNTQPCALQCSWTQWCAWSGCSTANQCEIGIQSRSRQCVGEPGCHCLGLAEENQQCRGQIPCSTNAPPC